MADQLQAQAAKIQELIANETLLKNALAAKDAQIATLTAAGDPVALAAQVAALQAQLNTDQATAATNNAALDQINADETNLANAENPPVSPPAAAPAPVPAPVPASNN